MENKDFKEKKKKMKKENLDRELHWLADWHTKREKMFFSSQEEEEEDQKLEKWNLISNNKT